ncbi:MAG: hypothetical protein IANPNBLG_03620 [Bryobacteraceae bacterium]|nr:hypothetical protein [Bryobacteraceae bacterium]
MWRQLFGLFMAAGCGLAQDRPPAPLVRGVFQDWVGAEENGTFRFHTADLQEHRCRFTSKTYFEQDHRRTYVSGIAKGENLEILSERTAEPPRCRALIVRVVADGKQRAPRPHPHAQTAYSPTESFAPRGNLLFTGIILRVEEGSIVLRNRSGVRQVIQLRQDTRYIGSGLPDMRQAMPMGRPVQVRAGKTFEGDVEAFTIMWGEILRVR